MNSRASTRMMSGMPAAALALALGALSCGSNADVGEPRADGGVDEASASSSPPIPTTRGLQAIWASSDSDVWVGGDGGTIVHFDGRAWSLVSSGVTENITSLHGLAADDVWAAGDGGSVLHWDGKSWKIASNVVDTQLLGVWVGPSDDVWAVGIDFAGGVGGSGYVRHFTGTTWDDSDVPGTDTLWRVWGSGPSDVWLVGTSQGQGLIYRGDGNFNVVAFSGMSVHGIWGTGPNDVWVAPFSGPLQHWTGTSFAAAPLLAANQQLRGVSGSGKDDVWAVGTNGMIGHLVGGKWSLLPSGTTETLFSLWTRSPTDAWLVGSKATVLRWNGTAWH